MFKVMNKLTAEGKSIIFISHKMREVLHISDRVTILRAGRSICTLSRDETTGEELANLMIGRELAPSHYEKIEQPGEPVIALRNVDYCKDSKHNGLDGVSLTINDGEFVFLVGPSGSGKTTIMKLITGEVRPTSGQIIVNDFDMGTIKRRKLPKVRRTLGVIFQDYRLIENMNVYDNVAFAMRVVGAANSEIKKRVPYILELVGLEGRGKRMPNELSGGEQQRVAIARALVNSPRMIVADEPTGNLDPVRSLELMLLFEKINEMGTTVMVVTHEKELVNAFSKRVITIDGGNLISDGMDGYYSYEIE